jgi:hypothetical protein
MNRFTRSRTGKYSCRTELTIDKWYLSCWQTRTHLLTQEGDFISCYHRVQGNRLLNVVLGALTIKQN